METTNYPSTKKYTARRLGPRDSDEAINEVVEAAKTLVAMKKIDEATSLLNKMLAETKRDETKRDGRKSSNRKSKKSNKQKSNKQKSKKRKKSRK